jgi:diacylglycerol kinase family enzyme
MRCPPRSRFRGGTRVCAWYRALRLLSVPKTSKSLLLANPTARTGKAEKTIKRAMEALAAVGLDPEFLPTRPEGTVDALAERLEREDVRRVVYLGGDGTFAEAAKGIILARERGGVDVPLAMLPMGTANNQGRSFGIMAGDKALEDNVRVVAEGVEQWLDVGRVRALDPRGEVIADDLWFDSMGFGLSARILAQRNRDVRAVDRIPLLKNLYRDKVLYVGAGFNSFFRTMAERMRFSIEITTDGEVHEYTGCTDIVVNGTLLYGGDWIFYEHSKPDDGKFEVIVMQGHGDWFRNTIASHKRNPVTDDDREQVGLNHNRKVVQGSEIELRVFRPEHVDPLPGQIDGEEFVSADHYQVENLFHYLRIIVPEERGWV